MQVNLEKLLFERLRGVFRALPKILDEAFCNGFYALIIFTKNLHH